MAQLQDNDFSMSSSRYSRRSSDSSGSRSSIGNRHSNTQATAYAVNARTMALSGFHFSTCGARAADALLQVRGRGFEVPLGGVPSPPPSPPLNSSERRPRSPRRKRSGDAAHHITEECERLFCETLGAVFLVEKNTGLENSLVMDALSSHRSATAGREIPKTVYHHDLPTPSLSPDGRTFHPEQGLIRDYVEMWDYQGGTRFRGFVAEKDDERTLFAFFDREVIGRDLKPALMALLELASSEAFQCSQLVACVDRSANHGDFKDTTRDLGWVGFELMMLDDWTGGDQGCTSDRYLFLGVDV